MRIWNQYEHEQCTKYFSNNPYLDSVESAFIADIREKLGVPEFERIGVLHGEIGHPTKGMRLAFIDPRGLGGAVLVGEIGEFALEAIRVILVPGEATETEVRVANAAGESLAAGGRNQLAAVGWKASKRAITCMSLYDLCVVLNMHSNSLEVVKG